MSISKPTIITLLDTPALGGVEQYVLDNSVFLNKAGHKIIIFTNNNQVKQTYLAHIKLNKLSNFEVHDLPYLLDAIGNWKGLVKFFFYLPGASLWFYKTLKEIKQRDKDVICLLVGYSDRMVFSPIVKYLKAKLIWVDIGPLGPVFERTWGFPKLLYHATKSFPDHFTTTSKYTMSSMLKLGNIAKKNITLVYPGIKLYTDKQIEKFRKSGLVWKKKNIETDILVSFVGRMAVEKEVDLLISAFAKAKKLSKKNIHLVIMGDGPDRASFESLVDKLDIREIVTFTGYVSTKKKLSILAASDIFVYPGAWEWEGFGMTTIEAMSVGTAVISPKFGPQMEIVKDKINGLNFKPHNPKDLAKKIIILSHSKKLRNKYSKWGLKTAKDNFSYEIMKKSLSTAVEKVS